MSSTSFADSFFRIRIYLPTVLLTSFATLVAAGWLGRRNNWGDLALMYDSGPGTAAVMAVFLGIFSLIKLAAARLARFRGDWLAGAAAVTLAVDLGGLALFAKLIAAPTADNGNVLLQVLALNAYGWTSVVLALVVARLVMRRAAKKRRG